MRTDRMNSEEISTIDVGQKAVKEELPAYESDSDEDFYIRRFKFDEYKSSKESEGKENGNQQETNENSPQLKTGEKQKFSTFVKTIENLIVNDDKEEKENVDGEIRTIENCGSSSGQEDVEHEPFGWICSSNNLQSDIYARLEAGCYRNNCYCGYPYTFCGYSNCYPSYYVPQSNLPPCQNTPQNACPQCSCNSGCPPPPPTQSYQFCSSRFPCVPQRRKKLERFEYQNTGCYRNERQSNFGGKSRPSKSTNCQDNNSNKLLSSCNDTAGQNDEDDGECNDQNEYNDSKFLKDQSSKYLSRCTCTSSFVDGGNIRDTEIAKKRDREREREREREMNKSKSSGKSANTQDGTSNCKKICDCNEPANQSKEIDTECADQNDYNTSIRQTSKDMSRCSSSSVGSGNLQASESLKKMDSNRAKFIECIKTQCLDLCCPRKITPKASKENVQDMTDGGDKENENANAYCPPCPCSPSSVSRRSSKIQDTAGADADATEANEEPNVCDDIVECIKTKCADLCAESACSSKSSVALSPKNSGDVSNDKDNDNNSEENDNCNETENENNDNDDCNQNQTDNDDENASDCEAVEQRSSSNKCSCPGCPKNQYLNFSRRGSSQSNSSRGRNANEKSSCDSVKCNDSGSGFNTPDNNCMMCIQSKCLKLCNQKSLSTSDLPCPQFDKLETSTRKSSGFEETDCIQTNSSEQNSSTALPASGNVRVSSFSSSGRKLSDKKLLKRLSTHKTSFLSCVKNQCLELCCPKYASRNANEPMKDGRQNSPVLRKLEDEKPCSTYYANETYVPPRCCCMSEANQQAAKMKQRSNDCPNEFANVYPNENTTDFTNDNVNSNAAANAVAANDCPPDNPSEMANTYSNEYANNYPADCPNENAPPKQCCCCQDRNHYGEQSDRNIEPNWSNQRAPDRRRMRDDDGRGGAYANCCCSQTQNDTNQNWADADPCISQQQPQPPPCCCESSRDMTSAEALRCVIQLLEKYNIIGKECDLKSSIEKLKEVCDADTKKNKKKCCKKNNKKEQQRRRDYRQEDCVQIMTQQTRQKEKKKSKCCKKKSKKDDQCGFQLPCGCICSCGNGNNYGNVNVESKDYQNGVLRDTNHINPQKDFIIICKNAKGNQNSGATEIFLLQNCNELKGNKSSSKCGKKKQNNKQNNRPMYSNNNMNVPCYHVQVVPDSEEKTWSTKHLEDENKEKTPIEQVKSEAEAERVDEEQEDVQCIYQTSNLQASNSSVHHLSGASRWQKPSRPLNLSCFEESAELESNCDLCQMPGAWNTDVVTRVEDEDENEDESEGTPDSNFRNATSDESFYIRIPETESKSLYMDQRRRSLKKSLNIAISRLNSLKVFLNPVVQRCSCPQLNGIAQSPSLQSKITRNAKYTSKETMLPSFPYSKKPLCAKSSMNRVKSQMKLHRMRAASSCKIKLSKLCTISKSNSSHKTIRLNMEDCFEALSENTISKAYENAKETSMERDHLHDLFKVLQCSCFDKSSKEHMMKADDEPSTSKNAFSKEPIGLVENSEEDVYIFPNGDKVPIFHGCQCMVGQYLFLLTLILNINEENLKNLIAHLKYKMGDL